jgi:hypothetical protein
VTGVTVARFGNGLAYEIELQDGSRYLVDAVRGTPIIITQAMAERAAQTWMRNGAGIIRVAVLQEREYHYWGSLPVHKITFGDRRRTVVYVSGVTGQVVHTTSRLGRVRGWITGLHTLEPLRLITKADAVRKGLLLVALAVGLAVEMTGFYLAFPTKRRP